jgi:SAM-dependent methyltransferase
MKKIKFIKIRLNYYVPTITRFSLEQKLGKIFKEIKNAGVVLDVGSSFGPYKSRLRHSKWVTLDIQKGPGVQIIADIHNMPFENMSFDTVLATEILEHCINPQKAIEEMYRLLKKNGILVLSTRFIYFYHPRPKDYYRFTKDSLKYLLRKFRDIYLLNLLVSRINYKDEKCPSGFIVLAKK